MYAAQSGMHSCKRIKLIFFHFRKVMKRTTRLKWSILSVVQAHYFLVVFARAFTLTFYPVLRDNYPRSILLTLWYSMMDHSTTKNLPLAWKKAFSRTVSLRNIYFYMFSHPKRILVYTYLRISFLKLVRVGPTPGKTMLL